MRNIGARGQELGNAQIGPAVEVRIEQHRRENAAGPLGLSFQGLQQRTVLVQAYSRNQRGRRAALTLRLGQRIG
jgi:hypothetical protein